MTFLESAKRWVEFIDVYGQPEEISLEIAKNSAPNLVWTLVSLGSDVLINGISTGTDVISYWKAKNPWNGGNGSLVYDMTLWIDCPTCEERLELDEDWDQDDCEECHGAGTMFIELEDCIYAQTEEDVFAQRQA